MNHLQRFTSQFRERLTLLFFLNNILLVADFWIAEEVFKLTGLWLLLALLVVPLLSMTLIPWISTTYLVQPTKLLWQAILHLAPNVTDVPAPDLMQAHFGKDLVSSLVAQIYQLANVASSVEQLATKEKADLSHEFVASSIPLPLFVLDKNDTIIFANVAMAQYLGMEKTDLVGKNVYSAVDMSFVSDQTFERWLQDAKANKVVADQSWERVRISAQAEDAAEHQCDMAAYYNKSNPNNYETMLILFDHTVSYDQDDQAMSFIAIAVHELRTPLTLLRGYIEAFQEELKDVASPELKDFMKKMSVSANQLSGFVNTILNVSRVENNQLELRLHREQWPVIVEDAINNLRARAEVRGIELKLEVDPDLPEVGVDRVSITEVINNLIDNAIKYSGTSKQIIIHSYKTNEGKVETTIKDFGVGIPASVVPHLFEKFYRNHRNRAQIGGTGLGLYLTKVIIGAHSGNIWVQSHEGEGTTFGFTVLPYSQVAADDKTGDNESADIVRSAHGWIKNHSMYRR